MKHTVLLLTASLLLATSLFGQKHNYDRVLPGHELTADLDFLWQNLQTTHASAFTYISQNQLKAQFDAARQRLANGATYPEFFLEVTALMAQINDTHSRVDVANLKNMAKKTKKHIGKPIKSIKKPQEHCKYQRFWPKNQKTHRKNPKNI